MKIRLHIILVAQLHLESKGTNLPQIHSLTHSFAQQTLSGKYYALGTEGLLWD